MIPPLLDFKRYTYLAAGVSSQRVQHGWQGVVDSCEYEGAGWSRLRCIFDSLRCRGRVPGYQVAGGD